MRKVFILTVMIFLSFFVGLKMYATFIDTQILDITERFSIWTLKENNGIYMIESNRVENAAESIEIQLDTVFTSSTNEFIDADSDGQVDDPNPYYNIYNAFVASSGSETTRINIYSSSYATSLLSTVNFTYEAAEVTEFMFLNEGTMVDPDWTVNLDPGVYYSITIVLNEALTMDQRERILNVFNNGGAWGSMLPGETYHLAVTANVVTVYVDPNNPGDLDLLPTTQGTIFDDVNNMADVFISNINGYEVDFTIHYDTIYDLRYTFSDNTDMSIFNDNYEAFYYTYEDQHFMVFNKGTSSLFLTSNWKTQAFIPYTIWNLDTGEFVNYNQIDVYMYMTLGDANHIVGYFYVDDFVIDRLMQVSTVFNYRWDPLIGNKSDWMPQAVVLEDTAFTQGNTSWQFDAVAISASSTAVLTAIAASIPGGQPIALGIFLIGSVVTGYFDYLANSYPGSLIVGDTSEISRANPSPELKAKINQTYSNLDSDFTSIDTSTYPLWKLDFGAYDKFGNTPEVDPDSIEVISLTYQTDGLVYTLAADEINTNADVDDYLDPYNDSTIFNPYPTEPSDGISINTLYYVIGAIAGYYILFDKMKIHKKPVLLILVILAAYYFLKTFGVI
ncbi:hypothetical protein BK010_02415 [Tenericutes bacterium MO-XQ]|nr:hypothetical protein BK010_02415 [Tenericutes bacterium MO-XQ]